MGNMRRLLILCLFGMINAPNVQGTKVVKAGQATREDVESLRAITSKEALPYILFASPDSEEFQDVFGLTEAVIDDGRLVSGTTFFTKLPATQLFLCPNRDPQSTKQCLVPKQFEETQKLECEFEPMPRLEPYPETFPCGKNNRGDLFIFTYEICGAEQPFSYLPQYSFTYSICYDSRAKKNLFVGYSIVGAVLLSEDLLIREREIEFAMNTESYGLIDENYYDNLQATIQRYPKYGLQQLVPTEDMILATSRKATRYYANFALQHNDLIGLWNDIRNHIRNHAQASNDQVLAVVTGVIDIPEKEISSAIGENQVANIWITVIKTTFGDDKEALVIVMNNFIGAAEGSSSNVDNSGRNLEKQYIDKICRGENLCVDSLKQKFEEVGGQVRCCRYTLRIAKLFIHRYKHFESREVLHINNIA